MVTVFREELNKLYTVDGVTPDSVASVLILQPRWAHRYWKRATTAVLPLTYYHLWAIVSKLRYRVYALRKIWEKRYNKGRPDLPDGKLI